MHSNPIDPKLCFCAPDKCWPLLPSWSMQHSWPCVATLCREIPKAFHLWLMACYLLLSTRQHTCEQKEIAIERSPSRVPKGEQRITLQLSYFIINSYTYIYMYRYIVRTIYNIYIYISPWNPIKSPWIRFLNLGFCSPIVPPSSWGGQVAKGCESGVASKYAQTRTTLVHPSLKFPWNSKRLLRLADEASTKQKLILLSAVQQLVSSPHPTSLSKNWDEYRKNTISIPSPYCWKWWVALVFFGLGSLRFSMGPIEK